MVRERGEVMGAWKLTGVIAGALGLLGIGITACGTVTGQGNGGHSARNAPVSAASVAGAGQTANGSVRATGSPRTGPVPAGFAATSVTFVSPSEAFVLGTAPCVHRPCTSIVRTLNRGRTWRGLPAPVTPLTYAFSGRAGVWGIRFGTPSHGFVFGRGLWETRNGGENWIRDSWPHGSIISLAVIDGQVLALADRCRTAGNGCGPHAILLRRPLGGGRWVTAARVPSPALAYQTEAIATRATVAAVLAGNRVLVTGNGGLTVRSRATPCTSPRPGFATSVAVTSTHGLALLCTGQGFTGHTIKRVYVSRNDGRSWTRSGQPSSLGDGGVIAAASTAHLCIATYSAASWLFCSADGGARWSIVRTEPDGGMGWSDLGFTTSRDGVVVRGPADTDGNTDNRPGWLRLTQDAGTHWHRVRF